MTNASAATKLTLAGLALLQAGNLREADQRFRSAYALDQRNAQSLLGLGIIAHQTGNFTLALDFFDRALHIDVALAAAHVNRGTALAAMQQHALAVAAFETALLHSANLPVKTVCWYNCLAHHPAVEMLPALQGYKPGLV